MNNSEQSSKTFPSETDDVTDLVDREVLTQCDKQGQLEDVSLACRKEPDVSASCHSPPAITTGSHCSEPTSTAPEEMSKRQRKRLLRHEAYLAQRPAKRRAERERRKLRNRLRRAELAETHSDANRDKSDNQTGVVTESSTDFDVVRASVTAASSLRTTAILSASNALRNGPATADFTAGDGGGVATAPTTTTTIVSPTTADSSATTTVVLDLSLAHLMTDRELAKCVKQIQRCYALNRRAEPRAFRLSITSLSDRCVAVLERNRGWRQWGVTFNEQHYSQVFPGDCVTYLSSESECVLHEVDAGCVYIIGALVDHNRHKGASYSAANWRACAHAHTPRAHRGHGAAAAAGTRQQQQ